MRLICLLLITSMLLAMGLAACGGEPQPQQPASPSYSGIVAASEFVVGENRFPFGLASRDGAMLEDAQVDVRFYLLDEEASEPRATAPATWRSVQGSTGEHEHAEGVVHVHIRGAYVVASVQFDEPGFWMAEFDVTTSSREGPRIEGAAFQVKETSSAPAIGDRVPATQNLTIHDVESFSKISTRSVEDDMHNVSVAQALDAAEPFLVIFSSPQFCMSAICGPVTDEVARVHERFKERVEFIHIEPWDLDQARSEGRLVPGHEMTEWGLPSEPWTFLIDGDGRVVKRFEGLITEAELVPALENLLETG